MSAAFVEQVADFSDEKIDQECSQTPLWLIISWWHLITVPGHPYPIRNDMEFQWISDGTVFDLSLCEWFYSSTFGIDDFWMHRLHVIPSLKSWCTGGCSQRGSAGSALVIIVSFLLPVKRSYWRESTTPKGREEWSYPYLHTIDRFISIEDTLWE